MMAEHKELISNKLSLLLSYMVGKGDTNDAAEYMNFIRNVADDEFHKKVATSLYYDLAELDEIQKSEGNNK
jgi:hypothetical protein